MSEDAHARPSGDAPEPLYDLNVPTPTHAERARTLVAQISTGTLCTLALEPAGYPYGSFVTVALDDGAPIFLISRLAEHTKNLERDPRASLLVAEGGSADPLANGRVTMIGRCTRVKGEGGSARDGIVKLRLYRQLSRATHCALVRVCAALARASGQRSNSQPTRRANLYSRLISAFSIKGPMIYRRIAPTGLWSVAAPAADRA